MLLEVAKARHEQKSDSLFAAVVENAPRYLKQLRMQQRALKELAAHNKDAPIADTTAKMTGGRRRLRICEYTIAMQPSLRWILNRYGAPNATFTKIAGTAATRVGPRRSGAPGSLVDLVENLAI